MPSFRLAAALIAVLTLLVGVPASAGTVNEYYHRDLVHYFVTGLATETQALDSGRIAGWARTGLSFETYAAGDSRLAGAAPVSRFLGNPARGLTSHFYSAFVDECSTVKARSRPTSCSGCTCWLNNTTGQCPAGTNRLPAVERTRRREPPLYDRSRGGRHDGAEGYVMEGSGSP